MKIIKLMSILCLSTVFSTVSVDAQWKITPEAGVNIMKSKGYPARVGAKIGVGVRYSFNGQDDGFGIRSGLYYTQQNDNTYAGGGLWGRKPGDELLYFVPVSPGNGSLSSVPDNMEIESVSFDRFDARRDYLQVPVMAQYAWKITPDIRLHVAAGPYVALGIGGKIKQNSTYWNIQTNEFKDENRSKKPFFGDRFDAGVSTQIGLEVKQVALLLNYETNLYKRKNVGKENVISIGVGYTF